MLNFEYRSRKTRATSSFEIQNSMFDITLSDLRFRPSALGSKIVSLRANDCYK